MGWGRLSWMAPPLQRSAVASLLYGLRRIPEVRCLQAMDEFDELKTPEERRAWLEALHEMQHGPTKIAAQSRAFAAAIGGSTDKETVLAVLSEIVEADPVEKGGTYVIGDWKIVFDDEDNLQSMSASSGVPGMIRAK